jgi:hypothetical protein
MLRSTRRFGLGILAIAAISLVGSVAIAADDIKGDYLETRTCDVYTGPCFANAQVGLTGKEAIMAWSVDSGSFRGVDLTGLKVVAAVKAADTLGFGGGLVIRPDPIKSVLVVDERATPEQREALIEFAKERAGRVLGQVARVESSAIDMSVDHAGMVAKLDAGKTVQVETRKLGASDCVCTNEEIFYPPLTSVQNSAPAFTVKGSYTGRGLGTKWESPLTRSAFLATF